MSPWTGSPQSPAGPIATTNDGRFVFICSVDEMKNLCHILDELMREEPHANVSGLNLPVSRRFEPRGGMPS